MSRPAFHYAGPPEIREQSAHAPAGTPITSAADLRTWIEETTTDRLPDGTRVATYVVTTDEVLRLAPRRSEHVACAGGDDVLAAGEIGFDEAAQVVTCSNHSTGYCPDLTCWSALADCLTRLGLAHPEGFTTTIHFRRCPQCAERVIVTDDWFTCPLCEADLPREWNFGGTG